MRIGRLALASLLLSAIAPVSAQDFASTQLAGLRAEQVEETDPERQAAIMTSIERLEALGPMPEGPLLVVNIPAFELSLWEGSRRIDRWRVIVGKPQTKTPEFRAEVEAVIVNPWWNVPDSIVRESVGALVRKNPAEARRRGYVWSGGSYRQRPGPNNALGLIKLVLPNPFRVGMHDTPSRELFEQEVRAFSHGCIRIQHIDQLAARLIGGDDAPQRISNLIARGRTVSLRLNKPVPVIVGYFPAEIDEGTLRFHPDIYGRLTSVAQASAAGGQCAITTPTGQDVSSSRVVPPNIHSPTRECPYPPATI